MSQGNGNNGTNPIVAAIEALGRDLGARIDATNERVDILAKETVRGFDRLEGKLDATNSRLDALVVNTGTHWRDLDARVRTLEARSKD